jgi:hypothetical protein
VFCQGKAWIPTTNSDNVTLNGQGIANSAVSSGFDSTTTNAINVLSQFSVNDATNSITCTNMSITVKD